VDTSSSKPLPSGTYKKLPANDEKEDSNDVIGKGEPKKKTGVLCSAIAKKVMADGTNL